MRRHAVSHASMVMMTVALQASARHCSIANTSADTAPLDERVGSGGCDPLASATGGATLMTQKIERPTSPAASDTHAPIVPRRTDTPHRHPAAASSSPSMRNVVRNDGPEQSEQHAESIDMIDVATQLSRLTFANVTRMNDHEIYDTVRRYLLTLSRLERLGNAKTRSVRLRARLARKKLRVERATRQLLFIRFVKSVEEQRVALELVGKLLTLNWPMPLAQVHKHIKVVVAAHITTLTYHTQCTAKQNSGEPRDTTASGDGNLAASGATLTPGRARKLLIACAGCFPRRVEIVGPLATIGFADIDAVTNAEEIVECMWAVHTARTHAPDSFWRRAVARLVALHRGSLCRSAGATCGTQLTVPQLFRALRVVKLEHWCGDLGHLSYLVSEALREVMHAFQSHPERRVFELPPIPHTPNGHEVARRVAECTQGLAPSAFLSLLVIAGDLGHTFQAGFDTMSDGILAPMIHHLTSRNELQLLCEMLRVTRNHTASLYQAVMDSLVRLNRVDGTARYASNTAASSDAGSSPSWEQNVGEGGEDAVADALDTPVKQTSFAGSSSLAVRLMPYTIPILELVVREVVRSPGLAQRLQVKPFLHLMLIVAREKRKFSPTTILSFTDNMYLLHRHLDKSSNLGTELCVAIDEFAFQIERLLAHALVSVNLVNRFLEYSIMLGMKGDAASYPRTAALRAARDALYQRHHTLGLPFSGIIPSHPARRHVVDVYQELFHATIQLGFYHQLLSKGTLKQLRALTFQHGVLVALEATCVYKAVHYERPGAFEHPTVHVPPVVQREMIGAILDRIRSCALSEPSAMRGVDDAAIIERLRLTLRLPDGVVVDTVVAAMAVDAAVTSPLSAQLARNKEFVHFMFALVNSSCGSDLMRTQVQQWARAANAPKGGVRSQ